MKQKDTPQIKVSGAQGKLSGRRTISEAGELAELPETAIRSWALSSQRGCARGMLPCAACSLLRSLPLLIVHPLPQLLNSQKLSQKLACSVTEVVTRLTDKKAQKVGRFPKATCIVLC